MQIDPSPHFVLVGKVSSFLTHKTQLEQALEVSEKDVKDASAGVLQDLRRFQKDKEVDLRRYMVCKLHPLNRLHFCYLC